MPPRRYPCFSGLASSRFQTPARSLSEGLLFAPSASERELRSARLTCHRNGIDFRAGTYKRLLDPAPDGCAGLRGHAQIPNPPLLRRGLAALRPLPLPLPAMAFTHPRAAIAPPASSPANPKFPRPWIRCGYSHPFETRSRHLIIFIKIIFENII